MAPDERNETSFCTYALLSSDSSCWILNILQIVLYSLLQWEHSSSAEILQQLRKQVPHSVWTNFSHGFSVIEAD